MKEPIILRWVVTPNSTKTFKYKTLAGAKSKAHALVGTQPKLDPDGYLVNRTTGGCLFFQGVELKDLFPAFDFTARYATTGLTTGRTSS